MKTYIFFLFITYEKKYYKEKTCYIKKKLMLNDNLKYQVESIENINICDNK